jgi:hypothetical protein
MIRVTVELVPFGSGRPEVIARATIGNDGTGTLEKGNYIYRLWTKREKPLRSGRITDYPRLSRNVWHLLKRALNDAL